MHGTESVTSDLEAQGQVLQLNRIVIDERFQFRPLERSWIKRYTAVYRSGRTMPPVTVANLNGAFILTDGWHRIAALESLGKEEVRAVVVPANSEKDVHWLAAQANLEHGKPLKSREYREVFRAFIHARKHRNEDKSFKSYREIAAEIGGARGHTTIRNWMQADFPSVFRAMGGHGEDATFIEDEPPPDTSLAGVVLEALMTARAALRGVTDPYDKGDVIHMLELMLKEVKVGTWVPPSNQGQRYVTLHRWWLSATPHPTKADE
jgi:hypothetical protein